jgi:glycerol kinase
VFDHAGQIKTIAQKEFRQIFPQPGWVEHDPNEIWSSQIGVAAEAITHAGLSGRDIAAIGITNQRETTVVWDRRTGLPIYNAIVWQDRRTAGLCDAACGGARRTVPAQDGPGARRLLAGTKLRWILDNVPDARRRAEAGELAFGTIDCWLLWKLSGGALHVTDATNASRTLLFDITRQAWDDELLDMMGCRARCCPRCATPAACTATPICWAAGASRSPAWRATSTPRCSGRPAPGPAW